MIDFTSENIQKIILKKPKETARHTETNPEYISEVWYLDDDKLYQPIIRTPRLKVKYGAKSWSADNTDASDRSSWSYCVGLYNYDIDPEIQRFYQGIKDYDKHVITHWTSNKKSWNLRQNAKIKAKYFTALRRRDPNDDPYLIIKLITDKGKVLTAVDSKDRKGMLPTDITYGKYTDQYISPSFVLFNNNGIHPFWQAHQVVVSPIERVFLENCLLDVLQPEPQQQLLPPPPPPPTHYVYQPRPSEPGPQSRPSLASQAPNPGAMLGHIKQADLLHAIGKLKSSKPSEIPKGERNKITPEDLKQQHTKIKQKVKREIMFDSIKDMPVEGSSDPEST